MTAAGARGRGKKREPIQFEPVLIGGLKTTTIKKVACGDMFTACLTGTCCRILKGSTEAAASVCLSMLSKWYYLSMLSKNGTI